MTAAVTEASRWGKFVASHAHGAEGVRFFTQQKAVTARWLDPATHGGVDLGLGRFEDQFVVDLKQHACREARLPKRVGHADHGAADDVGGRALDRVPGVHEQHPSGPFLSDRLDRRIRNERRRGKIGLADFHVDDVLPRRLTRAGFCHDIHHNEGINLTPA